MRIAVVDALPIGGAKRVVYEQAKGLAKNHTLLYCTTDDELGFDFESIKNLTLKRFPISKMMGLNNWLPYDLKLFTRLLPQYWSIKKAVERFGADVVLIHPDKYTQAPFLLSLIEETPTIYFAEEWYRILYEPEFKLNAKESVPVLMREWIHRRILQLVDKVNVQQATKILTSSEFNKQRFTKAYGVETEVLQLGGGFKNF